MDFFLMALAVIGCIIGVVLIFLLIKFLFTNYIVSRVLCLILTIVGIIFAFMISDSFSEYNEYSSGLEWPAIIVSVFA